MTRLLMLMLACAALACASAGHFFDKTTEAAGVTSFALLLGPLWGILSWPLWDLIGNLLAEAATGTVDGPRLTTNAGAPLSDGALNTALPGTNMNTLIFIAAAAAFVYFGGLAWLRGKFQKRAKEDDAWAEQLSSDRKQHSARTALLERRVKNIEAHLRKNGGYYPPQGSDWQPQDGNGELTD